MARGPRNAKGRMEQASLEHRAGQETQSLQLYGPWQMERCDVAEDGEPPMAYCAERASWPSSVNLRVSRMRSFKKTITRLWQNKETTKSGLPQLAHPEDTDYTWALVFDVPTSVNSRKQQRFLKRLKRYDLEPFEAISHAFTRFVSEECVQEAMAAYAPATNSAHSGKACSASSSCDQAAVLRPALQCTIELTLACLEAFGVSIADCMHKRKQRLRQRRAVKKDSESPPAPRTSPDLIQWYAAKSVSGRKLVVCVRESFKVAEAWADINEYPVQLSLEGVEALGIKLSDESTNPAHVPYYHDCREFFRFRPDHFDSDNWTVLKPIDRIRLFYDGLASTMDLKQLQSLGLLQHSFPIHHRAHLEYFRKKWGRLDYFFSFELPLEDIRCYFGVDIAVYFLFLQHLAKATSVLLIPALSIAYWGDTPEKRETARPAFAFLLLLWWRVFVSWWKVVLSEYALCWGHVDKQSETLKELPNLRFHGVMKPSDENEHVHRPQVSRKTLICGRCLSGLLTTAFVSLLLILCMHEDAVFIRIEGYLESDNALTLLPVGIGCFCGTQISVVGAIWERVNDYITDLEQWILLSDFEASKRSKTAIVLSTVSFSSVMFFAFIEPFWSKCLVMSSEGHADSCLSAKRHTLEWKLCSLFIMRYVLLYGFVNELIKPYLKLKRRCRIEAAEGGAQPSFTEEQMYMMTYSGSELTKDYLNVLFPIGFLLCFGMVFPACVIFVLLMLLFRMRTDAWKLLHLYRRPCLAVAKNILIFPKMLELYGYAMIYSNVALTIIYSGGIRNLFPSIMPMLRVKDFWLLDMCGFFVLITILVIFWSMMKFVLPKASLRFDVERRRQLLQQHHLFYTSSFDGETLISSFNERSLKLDVAQRREDFSQRTRL